MACVFPLENFDANGDAEAMEKAMKGLGTDEKAIIQLLSARNVKQRKEIAETYKSMYGKDMLKELHSELSGNFRQGVLWSFYDQAHVNAKALFKAIDRPGTDEAILIDVLCSSTNHEIKAIKDAYQNILVENGKNASKRNLEADIIGDTSGDFRKLLVALIQANREENEADEKLAEEDAIALFEGGEKRLGTDEATFTRLLCSRSWQHICRVNAKYENAYGRDLVKAISNETSGDYKSALTCIVQTARNRRDTIAEMLYTSMKGAGTRDDRLIRIILAHAEHDLKEIEKTFNAKYKETLTKMIEGDTKGDYRKYLLAIIN